MEVDYEHLKSTKGLLTLQIGATDENAGAVSPTRNDNFTDKRDGILAPNYFLPWTNNVKCM